MSSETFTTAMFLIAAIISAGVLVNATFPVIYTLSSTISSSSHNVDERLSTDVKIITTYASGGGNNASIWIKNIGTSRIADADIRQADVFLGPQSNFVRLDLISGPPQSENQWSYTIIKDTNNYWDPGETLHISAKTEIPAEKGIVYFQFVLPTGLSRSTTFTASD